MKRTSLSALVRKFARYAAVSGVATATSLTVLGALVATRALGASWANVLAVAVGTVPSFELNRRWVWGKRGERSLLTEVVPFCVLSLAGLCLSTLTVGAAAAWATRASLQGGARTLVVEGAHMAARLNPYISFDGNARAAMAFYERVFGGT